MRAEGPDRPEKLDWGREASLSYAPQGSPPRYACASDGARERRMAARRRQNGLDNRPEVGVLTLAIDVQRPCV